MVPRYMLWPGVRLSVCPSVRLTLASIVPKWRNESPRKRCRMVADVSDLYETPMTEVIPTRGAKYACGRKNLHFWPVTSHISETVQDRDIQLP